MTVIDERLLNVDRHGRIGVPGTLWIAMAFLARYWLVVISILASARRAPETVGVLGGDFSWYMLALELPVIAVIVAAGMRKPDAARIWRAVWTRGRGILVTVAVLHIAAAGLALSMSPVWRRWPELFMASCAILDAAIAYGLLNDNFFRQLFADFPEPETGASLP